MTTLFSPQSKGCVHSRKKVAPLITTLFLTSIKGVCAFNEECGAPSPCFPIKGGGEPQFGFFTFWEGETLALPYLNPFFVTCSSSCVRRCSCACEFVVLVLFVFLVFECSCSVVDAWCSSFSAFVVFVFVCTCACEFGVCYLTSSSSPHPTISFHFSFALHTHCSSLCFARLSTIVIS